MRPTLEHLEQTCVKTSEGVRLVRTTRNSNTEPACTANLADAIGYARSEFRDGRSEKEVFALLLKIGQPTKIKGLIHELYLESLGVCTRDQIAKSASLTIGALLIVSIGLVLSRAFWIAPVLAGLIGLYAYLVDKAFLRRWKQRARRQFTSMN
jgi:hypothetical protein